MSFGVIAIGFVNCEGMVGWKKKGFGGGEEGRERESIKYKHSWGEPGGKKRIFGTRRREYLLWSIKWILFRMNSRIILGRNDFFYF